MIKRATIAIYAGFLSAALTGAQTPYANANAIINVFVNPAANFCVTGAPLLNYNGVLYSCQSNSYTVVSGGGPSFPVPLTAPQINGIFTVDGVVYTTLNSAFNAAAAIGHGTQVWIGPGIGNWALTSQMTEPEQAAGVSLISIGGSTTTFITATADMNAMLFKGDTVQGNFNVSGITFMCNSGSTVHAQYGLQLEWFRGGTLYDVTVQNCGTEDVAFAGTAAGHQFAGTFINLNTNYDEGVFTGPAGGGGPTPPNYGIHLHNNALDSTYFKVTTRNAHLAGMRLDSVAANNSIYSLHAFGYAASGLLPYSPSYTLEDASGGNRIYDLYCDGNTVSCVHLAMAGTGANDIFEGGAFYWPSGTSWPTTANFGTLDQAYSDVTMKGFWCFGLATDNLWTVASTPTTVLSALRTNVGDITGCNSQTILYDIGDSTNSRIRDLWLRRNVRSSGFIQGIFTSVDGSSGITGSTCSSFKNGICVAP